MGRSYYQAILICIIILILSMIVAIPSPLFQHRVNEWDPVCNTTVSKLAETELGKSNFKIVYQYVNGALRAVIPLLLLIYLNYKIIRVLYKNKIKKKGKTLKSKSAVTQMLITIVLTFTVCIFPDAIMTMMQLGKFFIQ